MASVLHTRRQMSGGPPASSLGEIARRFLTPPPLPTSAAAEAAIAVLLCVQSRLARVALSAWQSGNLPEEDKAGAAAAASACLELAPLCELRCGAGSGAGLRLAAACFARPSSPQ